MAFKWFKKKKKADSDDLSTGIQAETQRTEIEVQPLDDQMPQPVHEPEPGPQPTPEPEIEPEPEPEPEPEQAPQSGADAEADDDHAQAPDALPPEKAKKSLFKRLRSGLAKTRKILTSDIDDLFAEKAQLDEDMLEDLEELLITADIGVQTAMDLIEKVERKAAGIHNSQDLIATLKAELEALFETVESAPRDLPRPPRIIMVIGVNGVGKTTTIGKLAAKHAAQGEKVLIAAADTFRAAAVEQLTIWADRAGAMIVKHKDNADPAAVAYDAVTAAQARGVDTVFVDTAGRLHTKVNLMEELKKIKRSVDKALPGAPHEILLVLDATTGQNAISQAQLFNDALDVTGLVLTKLDGTAKGGVTFAICSQYDIPLHYIGVGEGIDDLQIFDPQRFVEALF